MSFIARTFPYFFRKGFLPFLKKQKYHTQPPAMATTTMPPITHQTTGLPVLLSCSASEDVLLTLLPEASNSSRPRASEELSSLEESSEDASLLDESLAAGCFRRGRRSQSLVPGWKRAPAPMGSGWREPALLGGCCWLLRFWFGLLCRLLHRHAGNKIPGAGLKVAHCDVEDNVAPHGDDVHIAADNGVFTVEPSSGSRRCCWNSPPASPWRKQRKAPFRLPST